MMILLALAAALPEVPSSQVQIAREGAVFVMRDLIANNPLYTFDRDEPGKSNCDAACAAEWRPLSAPADAQPVGAWTLVKRADGSAQWAFEGKPVYSFARDPEPVAAADGKTGTFRLIRTFPAQ